MNLKDFKIWCLENDMDKNTLFDEALICYNNRAYRAAYLLSYLGFAEYIRNMLIEYKEVPLKFKEKLKGKEESDIRQVWGERVCRLRDDDKWDEEFKNIMLENNYNIFLLGESIRSEFKVKKDLRNVCAHNKSRSITDATVEDLWDYIEWVKPLAVINGIEQLIVDNINDIIRFSSASEYKTKAIDVYRSYTAVGDNKREELFKKICKMIDYINYRKENNELLCLLFEEIFQKRDCMEVEWIKEDIDAELFVKLNVDNYSDKIDKAKIYKAIEKMDINRSGGYVIPNTPIFNMFRNCTNKQKKKQFVLEIYNNENNYKNWLDLVISSNDKDFYLKDEEILKNIIEKNNLKTLFENIKELYKHSNGRGTTDTLDYNSFTSISNNY